MKIHSILIFIVFLQTACGGKTREKKTNSHTNKSFQTNQNEKSEIKFKTWLNDTLVKLQFWETELAGSIIKKELKLSKDSLSFQLNTTFLLNSDNLSSLHTQERNIVDLLQEHDELPTNEYQISFENEVFFYPSSIDRFSYERVNEINQLKILEKNKVSEYYIVRGRLSSKLETVDKSGIKTVAQTEFIWNDGKLSKQKSLGNVPSSKK
jgi:hypothetical protein